MARDGISPAPIVAIASLMISFISAVVAESVEVLVARAKRRVAALTPHTTASSAEAATRHLASYLRSDLMYSFPGVTRCLLVIAGC